MRDRWQMYVDSTPQEQAGWRLEALTPPSRLGGSNGMTIAGGHLYVTQVFGSQVTAIDIETGEHEVFSPLGGGIVGPDDGIFGADGTFYATEPLFGRVTARNADGTYRVVRDDLPGANGVTMDHAGQRLFVDEFRPGGRLMELDPFGESPPKIFLEDLDGPNAPAMGPDGRLYFPQVFANQVWVYDLDSGKGSLAVDELSVPTAVKFDSRGRLVVSEAGAGRITAVDLATGRRETLAEVPLGIDNVSVGDEDRIFVSHYVDGRVAEETGNRHRILSEAGLLGPHGVSLGPNGEILVADGLSVGTVRSGRVERFLRLLIDLPTLVVGVAVLGTEIAVLAITGEVLVHRGGAELVVLADGLGEPVSMRPDGDGLLVTERAAGRVTRVDLDGRKQPLLEGLHGPGAADRDGAGGFVVSQGDVVELVDADGTSRRVDGFGHAEGLAVAGGVALVADVGRHELVAVDIATGAREVVVTQAPIGQPAEGVVPAAFCSVCADGSGFVVGCNGDGSIRRVSPPS